MQPIQLPCFFTSLIITLQILNHSDKSFGLRLLTSLPSIIGAEEETLNNSSKRLAVCVNVFPVRPCKRGVAGVDLDLSLLEFVNAADGVGLGTAFPLCGLAVADGDGVGASPVAATTATSAVNFAVTGGKQVV